MSAKPFMSAIAICAILCCGAAYAKTDFSAAAFDPIRKNHLRKTEQLESAGKQALMDLLEEFRSDFKMGHAKAKVAGNTRSQAVNSRGLAIIEQCAKSLKETGDFDVPKTLRRELRERISRLERRHEAIMDAQSANARTLLVETAEGIADTIEAMDGERPTSLEAEGMVEEMLSTPSQRAARAPVSAGSKQEDGAVDVSSDAGKEIARSGDPVGDWFPLGVIKAEVHALEVIRLPLIEAGAGINRTFKSEITMSDVKLQYRSLRAWDGSVGTATFRLVQAGKKLPLDRMTWPSPRNNWTLSLRARPRGSVPSQHAVILQVSGAGCEDLPVIDAGEKGAVTKAPPARVTFSSEPQGAAVYVDGIQLTKGAQALSTPFEHSLPEGYHKIEFKKLGFEEALIPDQKLTDGDTVSQRLTEVRGFARKEFAVRARNGWTSSGVDVKRGSRIQVVASGLWSCGNPREPIDAEGYPNNKKYFHYYLDPQNSPRILKDKPYGMLLMRIGRTGEIVDVGKKKVVTTDSEGTIYVGINESSAHVSNNTGKLGVRVTVLPR